MSLRWGILLLAVAAGCAPDQPAAPTPSALPAANPAEAPRSVLRRALRYGDPAETNLLARGLTAAAPQAIAPRPPSPLDALLAGADFSWLEAYQGSYTMEELRAQDAAAGPSVRVNSSWLFGGDAPGAGVRVTRNPETGAYEVRGGEVYWPRRGLGVSYEKDEGTGETRTFFNLKRAF